MFDHRVDYLDPSPVVVEHTLNEWAAQGWEFISVQKVDDTFIVVRRRLNLAEHFPQRPH